MPLTVEMFFFNVSMNDEQERPVGVAIARCSHNLPHQFRAVINTREISKVKEEPRLECHELVML